MRFDAQGGVLPGVTVTVVNMGTNSTTAVTTNESGQYNALFLIPGNYRVTVELSGFRTAVNEQVVVRVGERLMLDFTLQPGGVTEEVVVTAETPQTDSRDSSPARPSSARMHCSVRRTTTTCAACW